MTSACIEYWLMLHYKKYAPDIESPADKQRVLREVKNRVKTYEKGDYPVCTNFRLYDWQSEEVYEGHCSRFDILDQALNEKAENTAEESMKLLEAVKQRNTQWSVVFSLNDFSADYAVNGTYDKVYHLKPGDF